MRYQAMKSDFTGDKIANDDFANKKCKTYYGIIIVV